MAIDNSGLIVDALRKTQPSLSLAMDVDDTYLSWIKTLGAKVSLYRNYERGDHRSSITEQMRKMLRLPQDSSGFSDFNDNYMQIVVDKMAGRLHVNEITLGNPTSDKWLAKLLEQNKWSSLQGTLYRGAIRDGDSFSMIDPATLEWTSEPAFDGYSGVLALFYNSSNTLYWACKVWSEATAENQKETMRVIVYEENRISYWRGQEGGTELIPDPTYIPESLAALPIGNEVVELENGFGEVANKDNFREWKLTKLPVFHFANKYDNYSETGESELRPAIALQDVLNRTIHSMVMASEFSAFPINYAIGLGLDVDGIVPGAVLNLILKDASGNIVTEPTAEMVAFLGAVRVGQLQGSDISQYTNQIDKVVREISQATQTPIYGITNQGAVSGEALKQLEIGLIGKIERFQRQNEDTIRDMVRMSAEIQKTFNSNLEGKLGPAPNIDAIAIAWKSPEILDVTGQIAAYVKMRVDAPGLWDDDFYRAKIGGLMGMSQADVKTEGEKAEEANDLENLNNTGGIGDELPADAAQNKDDTKVPTN